MAQSELVSVVVPAYNSEATLASTLASVCRQTYKNLEIVVVNDGSTDGTLALAEDAARRDPRIRVLTKPNGGLSEARNSGIRASRGALVAPIDADDIWHPEKIARQMAAMAAGGPQMGFVYTGFRRIDMADRVLASQAPLFFSGRVFLRHLLVNFVANGSSLLIRREAFEAVGGYEPAMASCEDYLFQLLIARAWTVGVVPEYLTGYRESPGSMSSLRFRDRLYRSHLEALRRTRARHPETPPDVLAVAEAFYRSQQGVFRLLGERRLADAGRELWPSLRRAPGAAVRLTFWSARRHLRGVVRRRIRRGPPLADLGPFLEMDPAEPAALPEPHPLLPWLDAAARREEAFFSGFSGGPAAARGEDGRAEDGRGEGGRAENGRAEDGPVRLDPAAEPAPAFSSR